LERHGFTEVAADANGNVASQRGDVGIWGIRGQSAGSVGHAFTFIDPDNIIHCSSGYNGIAVSNHNWLWSINGEPPLTVYRYTGVTSLANNPTDQIVEVGSWIKFTDTYTVDDLQADSNIWQIRTNVLCTTGFTWDDNGIPAALVTEVDSDGYATDDQELAIGSLYKISGKFNVLDVGLVNGEWLAQVGFGSLTFWVDIASATEVTSDDPGTATPSQHQTNAETPPAMPVPPVEQQPTSPVAEPVPPVTPPEVTPPVAVPVPDQPIDNKENNMNISSVSKAIAAGVVTVILTYLAKHGMNLSPVVTDAANTLLLAVVSYVVAHAAVYFAPKNK
jgi:hypothetical protein